MKNLFLFIALSGFLALCSATFVYFADPYGLWNDKKFGPSQRHLLDPRLMHPLRLSQDKFDVVFLGSSRTREGFNPALIKDRTAYNAGFSGGTVYETGRMLSLMGDKKFTGVAIAGVDFFTMSPGNLLAVPSLNGPLSGQNMDWVRLKTLWGIGHVRAAFQNVYRYYRHGYYDKIDDFSGSYKGGKALERFKEGLGYHYVAYLSAFDPEQIGMDPEIRASLYEGIAAVAKNGGKVVLFLPPIHASRIYLNKLAGLGTHYDSYVNDLIALVDKADKSYPGKVELWDFENCQGILAESVPESPDVFMTYFYDSNHFTPAMGALLVNSVLYGKSSDPLHGKRIAPSEGRKIFHRNWDLCRTSLDPVLLGIVREKREERCLYNKKWCASQ